MLILAGRARRAPATETTPDLDFFEHGGVAVKVSNNSPGAADSWIGDSFTW